MEDIYKKAVLYDEEETIKNAFEYLIQADIDSAECTLADDGTYSLLVSDNQYDEAKELLSEYFHSELEAEPEIEEELVEELLSSGSKSFVKSADKYADMKSSAYTLILVGILGFIIVTLDFTGILNLNLGGNIKWLYYPVMYLLFFAFLLIGFLSMRSARSIKSEIADEENFTSEVLNWMIQKYSSDDIDSQLDKTTTEELKYYSRAEFIKKSIVDQFGELDEAYLDQITEDIYHSIYEEE